MRADPRSRERRLRPVRAAAGASPRGFTLIEVLIAIGLILALSVAMGTFVIDLLRSRERLGEAIERQRSIDALLVELERAIATTVVEDALLGPGIRGGSDRIEVVARGVAAWRLGDPATRSQALEDRDRLILAAEGPGSTMLSRIGVNAGFGGRSSVPATIRFRYFDGDAWLGTFDSAARGTLPRAIEVRVWWPREEDADASPRRADGGAAASRGDLDAFDAFDDLDGFDEVDEVDDDRLDDPSALADAGETLDGRPPDRLRIIALPDPSGDAWWWLLAGAARRRREAPSGGSPDRISHGERGDRGAVVVRWRPSLRGSAVPSRSGEAMPCNDCRRRGRGLRAPGVLCERRPGASWHPSGPPSTRRGFVLLAVLVVAAIGLLIAGAVLALIRAESAGAARSAEAARSQALGWSGVQAIAAELAAQRAAWLRGEALDLDPQYILEQEGPRLGVVRVLPLGPRGERLVAESGKLDLHELTAERLVATGVVDERTAAAVIAARDRAAGRRIDSVEGLLAASGLAAGDAGSAVRMLVPSDLYGSLEALDLRGAVLGEEADLATRILDRLDAADGGGRRGLVDLLTVHAVEPALNAAGEPRVAIRPPWSDEMGRAIAARLDEQSAAIVRQLLSGELRVGGRDLAAGISFERDRDLVEVLRRANIGVTEWSRVLEALTCDPATVRVGRLDINSASAAALQTLPGIGPDEATAIVDLREQLSPQERLDPLWPLLREILPADALPELIDRIGVRSARWRVRLACGSVDAEDPDGPIEQPTIWEVVVDLSEPTVRLAAIREISMLDLVARLIVHMPDPAMDGDPSADRRERMLARLDAELAAFARADAPDEASRPLPGDFGPESPQFGSGSTPDRPRSPAPPARPRGPRTADRGESAPPPAGSTRLGQGGADGRLPTGPARGAGAIGRWRRLPGADSQ